MNIQINKTKSRELPKLNEKERMEEFRVMMARWMETNNFDSIFLHKIKEEKIDFATNTVVYSMVVPMELCNVLSSLHGGAIATLVDIVSSIGILVFSPVSMTPSVSVDLTVNYATAAPVGETITIESVTYKQGKNLAFTETTLYNSKKKVIAKGTHNKFMLDAKM